MTTSDEKPPARAAVPASVAFILVVEVFERFGYFTVMTTKGTFMVQRLGFERLFATQLTNVFQTINYLTSWFGSLVADTLLGRYLTIGCFAIVYSVGMFCVAFAVLPSANSTTLFFFGCFFLVPLASGGIMPVVNCFGADQIEGPDAERTKERFYALYYGSINIGAAVALGIMTTIATAPATFGINEDYGFFVAYLSASMGMLLATIVFFSGTCFYIKKYLPPSTPRILGPIARTLAKSAKLSGRGKAACLGWILTIPFFGISFVQAFFDSLALALVAGVLAIIQLSCLVWAHSDNSFIVELAAEGESALSREEVQMTFQTIPVLIAVNMSFNFSYYIGMAVNNLQACQMNMYIDGGHTTQVNPSVVTLMDPIAIIVSVPLLEAFVLPAVERLRGKPNSMASKFVQGMACTFVAVACTLVLELLRKHAGILAPPGWTSDAPMAVRFPDVSIHDASGWAAYEPYMGQCVVNGTDYCSNCAPEMTEMDGIKVGIYPSGFSVFWMALPFFLTGIAEVMINPMLQYYAYTYTPESTRSILQAVCLTMRLYPNAIVSIFLTLLGDAVTADLNRGTAFGSMGIEVFYIISLAWLVVAVPLTTALVRRLDLKLPTGGAQERRASQGSLLEASSRQPSLAAAAPHGSTVQTGLSKSLSSCD